MNIIESSSNKTNVKFFFQQAKQDRKHLLVIFSGFGSTTSITYDFRGDSASNCRSNILWIGDDFNNECAYYICKDMQLNIEDSILSLIDSTLKSLYLNRAQCTLMGFSKGGSAALYYGLKYEFKNIIASCPQLHIGSYVSKNWPNVARNMMGDTYSQQDINTLDSLIPDLIKNTNNKDQHIYLISSPNDEQYQNEIAPYLHYFSLMSNFNFVFTKSDLAWQHNKVTRYNLPIILSIVYANGEGISPSFGQITNGHQTTELNNNILLLQRKSECLVTELASISYSTGKIYPKGISFIRGVPCERYDQIKHVLVLSSDENEYEYPLGKFIQKENNYQYYESEYCDYSAASFTSLGNNGIDISSIAQGSYSISITTTAGNITKSNPLTCKRNHEEYHLVDNGEIYLHASPLGTKIIKRHIVDAIPNIIFDVKKKWIKDNLFHIEGIFAIKSIELNGWGEGRYYLSLKSLSDTYSFKLGMCHKDELNIIFGHNSKIHQKSYYCTMGANGIDISHLNDDIYSVFVSLSYRGVMYTEMADFDIRINSGQASFA
ncbi:accessory Sec system protein Asp2 [Aeromonas piscicola]